MERPAPPPALIAPIWRRLLSWAVDWGVWLAVITAIGFVFGTLAGEGEGIGVAVGVPLLWAVWLGVQVLGTSPGLALLAIRIVRADGARPGPIRGFVRWLIPTVIGTVVFTLDIFLFMGAAFAGGFALLVAFGIMAAIEAVAHIPHACALVRRDRRTLYDLAAGTWVVMREA